MGLRVLVVEDDVRLARLIVRALVEHGYSAAAAYDGEQALDQAAEAPFEVVILDWMLPGLDGLEVCRALRDQDDVAGILMLTARDAIDDRVLGLEAGADDYLCKPFAFAELLARVRALERRQAPQGLLQVGDLVLDPTGRTVTRSGQGVELTGREFDLLVQLMRHAGRAVSRDDLLARVWGPESGCTSNVLDSYVHLLRKKLGDRRTLRLQTVRGFGFILRASQAQDQRARSDAE